VTNGKTKISSDANDESETGSGASGSEQAETAQAMACWKRPASAMIYGREWPAELCSNGNGECECDELVIRGKRVPSPHGHCCEYVRARSALVAQAVKIADARVVTRAPSEDDGVSSAAWTKVFAKAVDDLSKPLLNGANQG
jgi:hypothetical protein